MCFRKGLRLDTSVSESLCSQGRPGGVVEYQYTRKKIDKIPQIPPNIPKNNRSFEYFIPEIQRKWYTEYPYLSCNIPYTRFKTPLNTEYSKTLADPVQWPLSKYSQVFLWYLLPLLSSQHSITVSLETCPPDSNQWSTLIFPRWLSCNLS